MDAPVHFFAEGADITQATFEVGMGSAWVVWVQTGTVTQASIEAYEARTYPLEAGERLLFRTANSGHDWYQEAFDKDCLTVNVDAAQYLAARNLLLVNVDHMSVAPFTNPIDTYRTLLGVDIWVM